MWYELRDFDCLKFALKPYTHPKYGRQDYFTNYFANLSLTWDFVASTALTRNIPHSIQTENGQRVVETKILCCGPLGLYFSYALAVYISVNQWRSAQIRLSSHIGDGQKRIVYHQHV